MRLEITTEQLTAAIHDMLAVRCKDIDPSQPNLRFCPELVSCDGPARSVTYRFRTYGWMANPMGVTHGGMIAAILDASMGTLCASLYRIMPPTITMTTNYCRSVPLDTEVLVKVHATYPGGTNCQLTAEMYLPGEEADPLATTCGVYYTAHAGKGKTNL